MMEDTKTESQDNILPTLDWMLEAGGSSQAEGDPQAQVQGDGGRDHGVDGERVQDEDQGGSGQDMPR